MGGISGSLSTLAGPPIEGVVVEEVVVMVGRETEGNIADVVVVTLVTAIVAQEVVVVTMTEVMRDAGQDLEVILEVKETRGETGVEAGLEEIVATARMGEVNREETEVTREKSAAIPEEKEAGVGQRGVEKTPRRREVAQKKTEVIQEKSAATPEEKEVGVGQREVEKTPRMREVAQRETEVIQEKNAVKVIPEISLDQEVGANPANTKFKLFCSFFHKNNRIIR